MHKHTHKFHMELFCVRWKVPTWRCSEYDTEFAKQTEIWH